MAALEEGFPSLKAFVFPGDTHADAVCHVARAAIRRAERRLVTLRSHEPSIEAANLTYLNRLSALLFAFALCETVGTGQT